MSRELDLFPPPLCYYLGRRSDFPLYTFFFSFEDSLWSILETIKPDTQKPILIPAFFCSDVVEGLHDRGYRTVAYPLDKDLTPSSLEELIKTHNPSVFILYHPLGRRIPISQSTPWIASLPESCLLIEDCVDMILEPHEVRFFTKRHVIIDSLRKTTPLQGSRVFTLSNFPKLRGKLCFGYIARALSLHLLVRALHVLGRSVRARWILELKWYLFAMHSDGIGKSLRPASGLWFDRLVSKYIDHVSIKERRKNLAKTYISELSPFLNERTMLIADTSENAGSMRFLALRLPKGEGSRIAHEIEKHSIYIDVHFDDSPHCTDIDYLLIPLSPDMEHKDVLRITQHLKELL